MRIPFLSAAEERQLRRPLPLPEVKLRAAQLAFRYQAARLGGDFVDVVQTPYRLVFLLTDIAGARAEALDIAAQVQEVFRARALELFSESAPNVAERLTELTIEVNRAILEAAGGVRCAPAFLGTYNEELGMGMYVNAGNTPGLVKDEDGICLLEASGPPLGLFSHSTYDAQACVLRPGAVMLLVSKGLVESHRRRTEFGLERLKQVLAKNSASDAPQLCQAVLDEVQSFTRGAGPENDVTVLALVRPAAAAAAL